MCVRERESDAEVFVSVSVKERECVRERESDAEVSVSVKERESVCVRERERVMLRCLCVCL